jgi:hypothetical protein
MYVHTCATDINTHHTHTHIYMIELVIEARYMYAKHA